MLAHVFKNKDVQYVALDSTNWFQIPGGEAVVGRG